MKQTAVEWLYEKLEYVNWMRNRDEIYPELADQWRKHYLEQAKAMEKEQHKKTWSEGMFCETGDIQVFEQYYNETFKSQ